MNAFIERINAVLNNIRALRNECKTLEKGLSGEDEAPLRRAIGEPMRLYEEEAKARQVEYAKLSQANENKRQALEYVVSHVQLPPEVRRIVGGALGRVLT